MAEERIIMLAGNPNCGKTTLFNRLTGSQQHTGNWPGVTVERHEGVCGAFRVIDLPGISTLGEATAEERIAAACLKSDEADVFVCIADATCLARSLYLPVCLLALGKPMVLALNMMDKASKRGDRIDLRRLSDRLGVPVVPVSARSGEGVDALLTACENATVPRPTSLSAIGSTPESRYNWIDRLLDDCWQPAPSHDEATDRLDRLMQRPVAAYAILTGVLLALLWLVTGPLTKHADAMLSMLLARAADGLRSVMVEAHVATWLQALMLDGILPGMSAVISFTPMIFVLFICLSALEDSGYMSRAAFLLDAPMQRVGLCGKSIFPLLMGCGCTVPAVMAARSVTGEAERRRTTLLTPFIACGAKTPVVLMIASACLPGSSGAVMLCLQAGAMLLAAAVGMVLAHGREQGSSELLLMEMPLYRTPDIRSALRSSLEHVRSFLRRAASVILLASMAVWVLREHTFRFMPASSLEESMLGRIGVQFMLLLRPLGLGSPEAAAALLSGLIAKENVVSTLTILAPQGINTILPAPAAASFLVFLMLYPPCIAALHTIRREAGRMTAWASACMQTGLAWICSWMVYNLLSVLHGM